MSPKKSGRPECGRRESVGPQNLPQTELRFKSFSVGAFPFTAGACLDSGTGLHQKIPKGRPGAGKQNTQFDELKLVLTRANVHCVVGSIGDSSAASEAVALLVNQATNGTVIVLDPRSSFVEDVVGKALESLACAFDGTPFWTLQLSVKSSTDGNARWSKVTDIELAIDAPCYRRSLLYDRIGDFVCGSLEDAKKDRGVASIGYSNLAEHESNPKLAEECCGFVLLVRSDNEQDAAKDSQLLEALTKHFHKENFHVLAKTFSELDEMETAVAAEVDVAVFLPSSFECVSTEEARFEDWFLDVNGEGKKFGAAITLPDAAVLAAAVFEEFEKPEDSFRYRLRDDDCCLGDGDLRVSMVGPTAVAAEFEPCDETADVGSSKLDQAVLSIVQWKNNAATVTIPTMKHILDRTDSLLAKGADDAAKFALEQWRRVCNGSGEFPRLSQPDVAALASCGSTSVGLFLNGDKLVQKKNCTRFTPSVLRNLVQQAVSIETLPQTPFALVSKHAVQKLSFFKKNKNKKLKLEVTDHESASTSSASSGKSAKPRWKWNLDTHEYLKMIAKRHPGMLIDEILRGHKLHLLQRHYQLYDCDERELEARLLEKGENMDEVAANLRGSLYHWWTGTCFGKGVPCRRASCKAVPGGSRDDTWCGTRQCPKCDAAAQTTTEQEDD